MKKKLLELTNYQLFILTYLLRKELTNQTNELGKADIDYKELHEYLYKNLQDFFK